MSTTHNNFKRRSAFIYFVIPPIFSIIFITKIEAVKLLIIPFKKDNTRERH